MIFISFLLLTLGLVCSSSSASLRCKVRLHEICFLNIYIYCHEHPSQNCFCGRFSIGFSMLFPASFVLRYLKIFSFDLFFDLLVVQEYVV